MDQNENLTDYSIDLLISSGNTDSNNVIFRDCDPEEILFVKNNIPIDGIQRSIVQSISNFSFLYILDGHVFEKRKGKIGFFSAYIKGPKSERSLIAYEFHNLISDFLHFNASIIFFGHDDKIMISAQGFGSDVLLSDWYDLSDDNETLLDLLDVGNFSLFSAKRYFEDFVYILSRWYIFHPISQNTAEFYVLPEDNEIYLFDNNDVYDDFWIGLSEFLQMDRKEYGDDYIKIKNTSKRKNKSGIKINLLNLDTNKDSLNNDKTDDKLLSDDLYLIDFTESNNENADTTIQETSSIVQDIEYTSESIQEENKENNGYQKINEKPSIKKISINLPDSSITNNETAPDQEEKNVENNTLTSIDNNSEKITDSVDENNKVIPNNGLNESVEMSGNNSDVNDFQKMMDNLYSEFRKEMNIPDNNDDDEILSEEIDRQVFQPTEENFRKYLKEKNLSRYADSCIKTLNELEKTANIRDKYNYYQLFGQDIATSTETIATLRSRRLGFSWKSNRNLPDNEWLEIFLNNITSLEWFSRFLKHISEKSGNDRLEVENDYISSEIIRNPANIPDERINLSENTITNVINQNTVNQSEDSCAISDTKHKMHNFTPDFIAIKNPGERDVCPVCGKHLVKTGTSAVHDLILHSKEFKHERANTKINETVLASSQPDIINDSSKLENNLVPAKTAQKSLSPEILERSIKDLSVSSRIKNALIKNNVSNIEQLLNLTVEELSSIKNIGKGSIKELLVQIVILLEKGNGYFHTEENENIRKEQRSVVDENSKNKNNISYEKRTIDSSEKIYDAYHHEIELTDEQQACLKYSGERTLMVKGLAGAGKSLVLMELARRFHEKNNAGLENNVAIFTYQNTLVSTTKEFFKINDSGDNGIVVTTINSYIKSIYDHLVKKGAAKRKKYPYDGFQGEKWRINNVNSAILIHKNKFGSHRFHDIDPEFWLEEFDWMKDMNIWTDDLDSYLSIPRKGRGGKVRMSADDRKTAYQLFTCYCDQLEKSKQGDWADQTLFIIRHPELIPEQMKFEHVLIDEAQDLSLAQMTAIMMLYKKDMIVAMDMNQRIFNKHWTTKQLGIEATTKKLTKSMRTTKQIDALAESVRSQNDASLTDDDRSLRAIPEREGDIPELVHLENAAAEKKYVVSLIRSLLLSNNKITIGIIAAKNKQIKIYSDWLSSANIDHEQVKKDSTFSISKSGVKIASAYGAKGLEFDVVIIPMFVEGNFPYGFQPEDEEEYEQYMIMMRNLVYVSMTRAKFKLIITFNGNRGSRFIAEMNPELYKLTGEQPNIAIPDKKSRSTSPGQTSDNSDLVNVLNQNPGDNNKSSDPLNEFSQKDEAVSNFGSDTKDVYGTLLAYLNSKGIETVDKRDKGGTLWAIGDNNLKPLIQETQKLFGAKWYFKAEGGMASKRRPAWYTKYIDTQNSIALSESGIGNIENITTDLTGKITQEIIEETLYEENEKQTETKPVISLLTDIDHEQNLQELKSENQTEIQQIIDTEEKIYKDRTDELNDIIPSSFTVSSTSENNLNKELANKYIAEDIDFQSRDEIESTEVVHRPSEETPEKSIEEVKSDNKQDEVSEGKYTVSLNIENAVEKDSDSNSQSEDNHYWHIYEILRDENLETSLNNVVNDYSTETRNDEIFGKEKYDHVSVSADELKMEENYSENNDKEISDLFDYFEKNKNNLQITLTGKDFNISVFFDESIIEEHSDAKTADQKISADSDMEENDIHGVNFENMIISESEESSTTGDQSENENQLEVLSASKSNESNNSSIDENSIESLTSKKLDGIAEELQEDVKPAASDYSLDFPEIAKSNDEASLMKSLVVDPDNPEKNFEERNNPVHNTVVESDNSSDQAYDVQGDIEIDAIEKIPEQTTEISAEQDEAKKKIVSKPDDKTLNLLPDSILDFSENVDSNISETISEYLENQKEFLEKQNISNETVDKEIDEMNTLPEDSPEFREPADTKILLDVPDSSHQHEDLLSSISTDEINENSFELHTDSDEYFNSEESMDKVPEKSASTQKIEITEDAAGNESLNLSQNEINDNTVSNSLNSMSETGNKEIQNPEVFDISSIIDNLDSLSVQKDFWELERKSEISSLNEHMNLNSENERSESGQIYTDNDLADNSTSDSSSDLEIVPNKNDGKERTNNDYSYRKEQETEEDYRNIYYESENVINNSEEHGEFRRLLLELIGRSPLELINLIANKSNFSNISDIKITDSKNDIVNEEIRIEIESGSFSDINNPNETSADNNRVELENESKNVHIDEQVDLISENENNDLVQISADNDLADNNTSSSSTDLQHDLNENDGTVCINQGYSSMNEREPEESRERDSEKVNEKVENIEEIVEKKHSSDINNETIEYNDNQHSDSESFQYEGQLYSNKLLNQQANDHQTLTDPKTAWIKKQSLEVASSGRFPAYLFFDLRNEISLRNYNWQNSEDFIYSYSVYFPGITDEELKLRHKQAIPWVNDQRTINSQYQIIMQDTFDHRYVMIAYSWFCRAEYYYEPSARVQFVFNSCRGFFYPQEQQIVWNRLCLEAYSANNSY